MIKILTYLSLFFLSSCDWTKLTFKSNQREKEAHFAISSKISSFDTAVSYDNTSGTVIYNFAEQLYEYHYLKRPFELRPLLADGMPLIENHGKRYIIKIKKNVQFHSHPAFKGKPRFLIAQDFVNAFKRIAYAPLNSSGWWIIDGVIVGANEFRKKVGNDFQKFKTETITGLKAPNDHTLIIELNEVSPQFIYKLSMSFTSPIPDELISFYKNDLKNSLIGTGPFYYVNSNSKDIIEFRKFLNYRASYYPTEGDRYANNRGLLKDGGEKIPFLEKLFIHYIPEDLDRFNGFMNKEIDFTILPQIYFNKVFDQLGNLRDEIKSKSIHVQTVPTVTFWWLSFNMQDPLIGKNTHLRKAITQAINMAKYVESLTITGQKANSYLPPGIVGYDPNATLPFEYNLEEAKKELSLAGFPEGKNLPEITYDTRSESELSLMQANYFKSELAKIGIKLKIVVNYFEDYLEKTKTSNFQISQDGWTLDYADAENVFQLLLTGNFPPGPNTAQYSNKKFDMLYKKLVKLPEGPVKVQTINQMLDIVTQDLPWIVQYYERNIVLYQGQVKNLRLSDIIWNFAKYIRVKND